MGTTIAELKDELESLSGVESVEAYPADYDFCSPDIIIPTGGNAECISEVINNALNEGETALETTNGGYILYTSLGEITSPNGSEWDIIANAESAYEAVLTNQGSEETAHIGDVYRFSKDDTDYDVTIYDEA